MVLAFLFRIVPRVGPFKALAFKRLTPATEKIFMASFNAAIDRYRELLAELKVDRLQLPNENFDTGKLTEAGQYKLTDAAYANCSTSWQTTTIEMSPELRADMLAFYHNLDAPISTKTNDREWATLLKKLNELKAVDLHVVAEK